MPLSNPTPLRQEMYLTSLARSTPGFRIKQFLRKYFLSPFELGARGYDKLKHIGITERGFDGFISKNECLIDKGKVVVVCMIPSQYRVSFGEYVSELEDYLASFWCLKSHKQLGSASLNPDCLMMEVGGFPRIYVDDDPYEGYRYMHLAYDLNEIGSVRFAQKKAICYPVMVAKGFELIEKGGLKHLGKPSIKEGR